MRYLLSIKTVFPKPGGRVWYDDQRDVHRQIFEGDDTIEYAFMGQDPEAADNRWLREAFENQIPIIYFLGIAPGRYQAIHSGYENFVEKIDRACATGWPEWITKVSFSGLKQKLFASMMAHCAAEGPDEPRNERERNPGKVAGHRQCDLRLLLRGPSRNGPFHQRGRRPLRRVDRWRKPELVSQGDLAPGCPYSPRFWLVSVLNHHVGRSLARVLGAGFLCGAIMRPVTWCPTRNLGTAPLTAVDADRLTIRFNEIVDY
jgi:hypothetical protein